MSVRVFPRHGVILTVLVLLGAIGCASEYSPSQLAQATDSIRELYFARDYGAGVRLRRAWSEKASDARELQAWYVHHLTRNRRYDRALETGRSLRAEAPDNPWALFGAVGGTYRRDDEVAKKSLAWSREALERAPDGRRPDFLWLRGEVLREQKGAEAAIAFYRDLPDSLSRRALFLQRRAVAVHQLAGERESAVADSLRRRAFALFAEAREKDPDNVEANFLPGVYRRGSDPDAAIRLLRKAARLSPAPGVHREYCQALWRRRDLGQAEKKRRIRADIDSLLTERPDAPDALLVASQMLGTIGDRDRQKKLEQRLVERFPRTLSAEWALTYRYRRLRDSLYDQRQSSGEVDPELESRYEQLLVDYIERPTHVSETLLGEAYRGLFRLLAGRDSVDPDRFRDVVEGLAAYESSNFSVRHAEAAIELAEHTTDYRFAKQLARTGLDSAAWKQNRDRWAYDSPGEMVRAIHRMLALHRDALGWVYFHQDSLQPARQQLLLAYRRYSELPENLYHLGRLYERLDSLKRAEEFYAEGAMLQTTASNPADTALKRFYRERHGGLEGWQEYYTGLAERDAKQRRQTILANRIEDPEPPESFRLPTLEGDTLSLSELKGRVTVVHIWGMWCAPCVAELPGFQAFYEKYGDDPNVRVVTIDHRDNPDELEQWMEEKGYTFPVMLDTGYLQKIGHTTYPTTWFLNADGERAWVKEGSSESLEQEFTWRVEALLGSNRE